MRRFDRLRRTVFLATLIFAPALSLVGCFGYGPSDPSPGLQPAFIEVSSGDRQIGFPGAALRDDLVAEVRLETGGPSAGDVAPGAQVEWVVTSGGGTVDPAVSITDARGLAHASWTLGAAPGAQKLVARLPGFVSIHPPEAEFTATAVRPDGPTGAGGMMGTGGMPGTGGTGVDGFVGPAGTGGVTGTGGSNAPGLGGSNGGDFVGGTGGVHTGTSPGAGTGGTTGSGGAGTGGTTGSGGATGAGGAVPTCGARCIRDGAFCQCTVIPTECPQVFQVACPSGAAASCTCRINGAVTSGFPGTAVCDPTLLNAATACGFALVIPN